MKITQIVPVKENEATVRNEEEYDKYICRLYEDNFVLANTFETHKAGLLEGQAFLYHGKYASSQIRMSVSHDYTKFSIDKNGSLHFKAEVSEIKYISEGIHENFTRTSSIPSEASSIMRFPLEIAFYVVTEKKVLQFSHGDGDVISLWTALLKYLKEEFQKWKNYDSLFPSYLQTKFKCSRLAKINSTAMKEQENFEREREKLQNEYNTMHDMFDRDLTELKTLLSCIILFI